jgi:glycerol kinase
MGLADRLYLILDQGGHSSRAIIFNQKGELLESVECAVATQHLSELEVEQNPLEVADSLRSLALEAYQELPLVYRSRLESAALVCQRSSVVAWHSLNHEPFYPILSWQDRRAGDWLEEFLKQNPQLPADIHQRTGLFPNAHFGASKIRWLLKHVPAVCSAAQTGVLNCAPLAAWLIQQLTEEYNYAVDAGNASRTMLWNIQETQWDTDLLGHFAIPQAILPPVLSPLSEFGHIRLGQSRIPLRFVNGDQNAAFYAQGALAEGVAYINIGTGAFCAARANPSSGSGRLLKTLAMLNKSPEFLVEGTVNGAASALTWAEKLFGVNVDYVALDNSLKSDSNNLLFLNGVGGLGSPYWCGKFASVFIKISENSSADDNHHESFAAVAESVLFLLQRNLECIKEQGIAVRKIYLGGGLSQSEGLCQRLADLSGCIVSRAEVVEASARGAAFWLSGCPSNWRAGIKARDYHPQSAGISNRYKKWLFAMHQTMAEISALS